MLPKRGAFGDSYTYPAYFPGLGRGLDFLLPSFLSSRKEKKVGAWGQSPRFLYHKINISGKWTAFSSFIEYEYPKRGAFPDYTIVISRKRDTFSGNTVGAYCIRPTNVPSMERITLKMDTFDAFAILGMAFGGAYAIRPYIGSQKRDTFSGNTVGAYCIRPTNVPSMERIT